MNKKTKTKILTLSAVSALSLAAIWVLASNPNDLLFKWAVKQDAHLELSGVTLIAPTQSSNFDVSFKMSWDQLITLTGTNTARNSVQGNGTLSFWGSNNKTSDPESLILGGNGNEITNTAKENIIAASQSVKTAGESTTNYGKGNVILASSGVNLTGIGNILRAGNNTKIHGNDNLTFATDKVNISANNSMAIGIWIQIDHDGSFVFNGTSKWETTRKANTAIIKASNGMIINANTKTADNTDLTINGSLQVGQDSQIDTAGAIIYNDNCLQLKNTKLGRIGLNCPNTTNTESPFLSFEGVACGRNAGDYGYNEIQWHSGKKDSDFCLKGTLDGEAPKFFDSEDRAAAYKTRGGSYASEWFGYTFHICFNEQDPTCALPKLKKSWTCSDAKGNRLHCQATQDLGKKDPKQTPVSCPSGQHLENGKCISNTKTVDCDKTWINTANGSVNTSQVAITRSESTKSWSKPAKCDFTCNTGFKKSSNSNWNDISCVKLDLRWKCWSHKLGKKCVKKRIPTTYSCQWWKEAPKNCHCKRHDLFCDEECARKPREMYICSNLPRYQCEGAEGQKRWCSWLPNLISETNSCNTYTSESSCNRDSMCNRGFDLFSASLSADSDVCMEWDTIVDDAICKANNIANLCSNTSLDLSTTCPSGQHFENRSCESNTKTVACDATWIATTENGKTVNRAKQVQVTRSDITHSWSRPAKCDFTCATGYEERGNQCVEDTPKETEMCTYHWETTQIRDTNGSYTRGICKQIKTNSEPIRPRPWWVNRWSEHPREEKILPYTTESECRKNGGFFEHRWSSRPEVLYRQECKDQKGNTTLDTSRCAPPFKEYPCQSATESPRPTPPPHPWKPETPPPRTWWNQGPPPRPWKSTTRPPRNIVAVKCDANINQLTYDGWSESLSALKIYDGYYAEVSSMPLDPKLNVNCWRSWSTEINLAGWGMNEASIRSELGLTDNDNVSIYHCPSMVPSVCGWENSSL